MIKKDCHILVLLLALFYLGTTSAYAGNGANLIGLTPQSAGRGGVGIGTYVGIESLTKNPAFLSDVNSYESLYGADILLLDPKTRVMTSGPAGTYDTGDVSSQTKKFVIPEMGFVNRYSDTISYGLGIFATSGFGVDFRNLTEGNGSFSNVRMFLMSLKAVPGISYHRDKWSVGASAHLGYGILDLAGVLPSNPADVSTYKQRTGGIGESLSAGYQLGASFMPCSFATIGITYQSDLPFTFKRVFDFNLDNTYDDFKMTLPKELGIGASTKLGKWELSADIKQVYWSQAEGFKQFRWNDQTVYAIGTAYTVIPNKFIIRFGGNYSPSVIKNRSDLSASNGTFPLGNGTFLDSNISYLDMVGLGPIVAGKSITTGAEYHFTKHLVLNGSIEYILPRTITQSGATTIVGADDTSVVYKTKSAGIVIATAIN